MIGDVGVSCRVPLRHFFVVETIWKPGHDFGKKKKEANDKISNIL
jgi:hypothetical protein